jgi:hypothetical protein
MGRRARAALGSLLGGGQFRAGRPGTAALSVPDDIRTVGLRDGTDPGGGRTLHEDARNVIGRAGDSAA